MLVAQQVADEIGGDVGCRAQSRGQTIPIGCDAEIAEFDHQGRVPSSRARKLSDRLLRHWKRKPDAVFGPVIEPTPADEANAAAMKEAEPVRRPAGRLLPGSTDGSPNPLPGPAGLAAGKRHQRIITQASPS